MSLAKWSPLKELEDMRRDMDRLFEEIVSSGRRRWSKPGSAVLAPNIELYDRQDELVLKAELPGVVREDIDLTIAKDSITIKGEIKRDAEVKAEDYFLAERMYGAFCRAVPLPFEIEEEKISASFKNGILEVILPKQEDARPKEVKIEVK
ncbi:MAG TPA: Hsp20/alpha crystallin family protein [Dissulfurispiraceae bacterium]|nr:Hsp20/alpha crystallin family protein [Dissulfurispiraceae bacterium]